MSLEESPIRTVSLPLSREGRPFQPEGVQVIHPLRDINLERGRGGTGVFPGQNAGATLGGPRPTDPPVHQELGPLLLVRGRIGRLHPHDPTLGNQDSIPAGFRVLARSFAELDLEVSLLIGLSTEGPQRDILFGLEFEVSPGQWLAVVEYLAL